MEDPEHFGFYSEKQSLVWIQVSWTPSSLPLHPAADPSTCAFSLQWFSEESELHQCNRRPRMQVEERHPADTAGPGRFHQPHQPGLVLCSGLSLAPLKLLPLLVSSDRLLLATAMQLESSCRLRTAASPRPWPPPLSGGSPGELRWAPR